MSCLWLGLKVPLGIAKGKVSYRWVLQGNPRSVRKLATALQLITPLQLRGTIIIGYLALLNSANCTIQMLRMTV